MTVQQSERFEHVRSEVDGEQLRLIYERALTFEHDYLYQDALQVYDELLARVDYYEDSRARRETLASYIKNAERLYQGAASCGDKEEELSLLRQIEIFWPEYLDIQARITSLEKASN